MQRDKELAGRTAFVSGSGRNIGRAIALRLAARGCNVIFNGARNRDACEAGAEEARKLGVDAMVTMGDMAQPAVVSDIAREALARFGQVEILVNNAAIRPHKPFLEMADDDWYRVINLDLNAAFHTCRAFMPGMVAGNWGRIVNITGMNAIHGYSHGAPISAAKHGLWGLSKSLAKEFGPHGLTVNAISPGTIEGERDDPNVAARMAALVKAIPLGHLGQPDDIAALVAFLCVEGRFVTGQMIASNGGVQT